MQKKEEPPVQGYLRVVCLPITYVTYPFLNTRYDTSITFFKIFLTPRKFVVICDKKERNDGKIG
jgi:hypothetical protein